MSEDKQQLKQLHLQTRDEINLATTELRLHVVRSNHDREINYFSLPLGDSQLTFAQDTVVAGK